MPDRRCCKPMTTSMRQTTTIRSPKTTPSPSPPSAANQSLQFYFNLMTVTLIISCFNKWNLANSCFTACPTLCCRNINCPKGDIHSTNNMARNVNIKFCCCYCLFVVCFFFPFLFTDSSVTQASTSHDMTSQTNGVSITTSNVTLDRTNTPTTYADVGSSPSSPSSSMSITTNDASNVSSSTSRELNTTNAMCAHVCLVDWRIFDRTS